ncbi:MAG: ParB N-terminal domain-containing protein, partial [Anaerolineales bacterium]
MNDLDGTNRVRGLQQFRLARRKARLNRLMSRLTGRPDELLVFDEVRQALDLAHPMKEELKDIPLDRIVGTVNRYHDFNRQFNPIQDSDEDRWARVKEMMEVKGLDPIEVYQVDDIYFVLDGNHRVSVSRQFGSETIQAYVKEFRTEIDLEPEDNIQDVVLKAEWNELMADTQLYW